MDDTILINKKAHNRLSHCFVYIINDYKFFYVTETIFISLKVDILELLMCFMSSIVNSYHWKLLIMCH